MITKQDYYNLLVRSARDGTFPSITATGSCWYRGPGHKRCAVGVLIPDEAYKPEYDVGLYSPTQLLNDPWKDYVPAGMTVNDLLTVQNVHDLMARASRAIGWNPSMFIQTINTLSCFNDCVREEEVVG